MTRRVSAPAIRFERLCDDAIIPVAGQSSPVYDLAACLTGTRPTLSSGSEVFQRGPDTSEEIPFLSLLPGELLIVPLGFRAKVPRGYEVQVRSRSDLVFTKGLVVADAPAAFGHGFDEEWSVTVRNSGSLRLRIEHQQLIARAVIAPVVSLPFLALPSTGSNHRISKARPL